MVQPEFTAPDHNPALASGLVVLATVFFAASTFMAKTLGTDTLGPALHAFQVTHGRFFFAFLAIATLTLVRRRKPSFYHWRLHILRTLFGFFGVTLMFASVAMIPMSDAIAISFLNPVFAMIFAIVFLGERVGPWRWIAAGIAFTGALILIRPGASALQIGALVALGSAALIGTEVTIIKRLAGREGPLQILFINNLFGVIIASIMASFVWSDPTPAQWLALIAVGLFMICGQGLFVTAIARSDASFVAPFTYATLIFATLLDLAIFGVVPGHISLLGAGLIIAAGLVLAWRETRSRTI